MANNYRYIYICIFQTIAIISRKIKNKYSDRTL